MVKKHGSFATSIHETCKEGCVTTARNGNSLNDGVLTGAEETSTVKNACEAFDFIRVVAESSIEVSSVTQFVRVRYEFGSCGNKLAKYDVISVFEVCM